MWKWPKTVSATGLCKKKQKNYVEQVEQERDCNSLRVEQVEQVFHLFQLFHFFRSGQAPVIRGREGALRIGDPRKTAVRLRT
jgi:hypothetical protein